VTVTGWLERPSPGACHRVTRPLATLATDGRGPALPPRLGLTAGCLSFAAGLRAAGHVVHTPDLYDGKTLTDLSDGVGHAEEIGFATVIERGLSLGVLPAQTLAQTRPGARGALLLHACVAPEDLGCPWPEGLPLQIHTMEDDEWGDAHVARRLAETIESAELYLYPGDRHLFTDCTLPDYDEGAAALLETRVLAFLDGVG
jgi:dienelactone hydrolase